MNTTPRKSSISTSTAEFARRLQAQMEKRGWSQSELARQCSKNLPQPETDQKQYRGISRDLINRYVRGLVLPRRPVIAILAKTFKCDEMELVPPGTTRPHNAFETKDAGRGRVALRISGIVSIATATKIMVLLRKEDAV